MNIEELIYQLDNCDLSKVSHNKIISLILKNNIQLPIFTSKILKGAIIQRGRTSEKGEIYTSEFDISYRTDIGNIDKYGRANRPFQSMFYGAMPSAKIKHPIITLFTELVEQFSKIPITNYETTITVGSWIVKKDMEVADICFSENYLTSNENIERYNFWNEKIKGTKFDLEKSRTLLRFFSNLFSKKEMINKTDYKLSSIYTDFVLREKLKGILYPSVKTDYDSRNIVLTPNAVEDHLELMNVGVFKYTVKDGKPLVEQIHYSDNLGFLNSNFEWK